MADVSNELIYEVLKAVQDRVRLNDEKVDVVIGRLASIQQQLAAVRADSAAIHIDVGNIYHSLGKLDARVERIERRLELSSEPAE